ncbi:HAD family hydrolase [Denitrificimonas sp. JX-1]|uniref:HAD family hydrolase n=1 Tax=Denitrificimonas halotolerans TaxID=3098930 RepID=A0ABU5GV68_9GAMM|nr:HAD family hydrolase [Denitrificimonas sp. JX-1]MDY7220260.1 HAD family hydrolase [Denitrificimonas sp. JX-1]
MSQYLKTCQHWVFDMDGTLTIAVHDFLYIRRTLEIPDHADILGHLASLPELESQQKHAWLIEHERQLALNSEPAPGAIELVRYLHEQGRDLAILTRNAHELAHLTLQAIDLLEYFEDEFIFGREQAIPKPHPDGLLKIAQKWQVTPQNMTMVGDFSMDLKTAKAAGSYAVQVNTPNSLWPELTDFHATDCHQLLTALTNTN